MEGTTPPSPHTPPTHDTPAATYPPPSAERYAPEPDKRPGRTAFQRDRARVLHSAALRRLAGKTQVVTPGTRTHVWDASPRTRLTHSLECAQVGRELGAALGCDPDLVEAACLSHDLGHPPFGHNGEQALNEFAEDCGGFEGNAQSLRLLTRIEPKRFVRSPESGDLVSVGLNLTRAALDAATKYPWPRGGHPTDPASPKFGVYDDDRPVFDWVRKDAPGTRTTFEAQVMDWSDDVAYSVHDVEDGLHAGHIDPNCLHADPERQAVFEVARGRYVPADTDPAELAEALDRLLDQEWWPHGYDGTAVAQARLKDATSQLIGRFCLAAEGATRQAYGGGPLTRYAAELVVPREARLECAVLKAVADRYVMQRDEQERLRADQRVVVAELAEALTARAPEGLEPQFRALFDAAPDNRARKRVIVDQIASLTDTSARASHARLTGRM
ncbi:MULTISPECIES: deoxyguanosinetriphosphate triphosphohydrolase [Streptomyces]|uniref:Deoxyguanosinetriphosphate triphosphohydrolase-like protein n=1 Tax=Streptomyces caniscabiei TaxID=2746961 RepID=A0ABU4MZE9_9ACTN|nr:MULTISPECIES: deoxyguanosinetriphosphate triphosphohydrolase [Streptomyces]MBE4737784.1 deoxyguanosinetriphosphate triphosphohydrolase [Streptomyces caniscabiei]MBE4757417.1 deoxyguanosinetriphosphate triphosphohydrolase [Streptomyces caniscabiei]MBE4769416.1 deoxyguanosinetriphosphate triphosphohydrolase [Streptomyces caniscabiei]MBE4784863.1 deoxyguanosinetriphosphate triphosphohydrolase [Streptomyces caniscabiei]MBE4795647.1 deoxyguanosinetriphosphate triphosphohydrolase [Streptomyces ca